MGFGLFFTKDKMRRSIGPKGKFPLLSVANVNLEPDLQQSRKAETNKRQKKWCMCQHLWKSKLAPLRFGILQ